MVQKSIIDNSNYSKQDFEELLKGLVLDEENGETQEKYPWKTTEDEMLLLKEKVFYFDP